MPSQLWLLSQTASMMSPGALICESGMSRAMHCVRAEAGVGAGHIRLRAV